MISKKIIFVLNDHFGHGGHVKSFISQVKTIEHSFSNIVIISSTLGYVQKNLDEFTIISKKNLCLIDLSKIRKLQFDYHLYKLINSELEDNAILHIYSPECYFSAALAKSNYQNVVLINSVMGGPNPFPCFQSTDLYIAVSKEQKDEVILSPDDTIVIIKNRIDIKLNNFNDNNTEKILLVVTRFDKGMQKSLNRIVDVIIKLPNSIEVVVAGTGELHNQYKQILKKHKNINLIGYCKSLNDYRVQSSVVLGMGRSVLESLLNGYPSVLIGYNGIELLESIENVQFASDYNFAGRKIKNDVRSNECTQKIVQYHEQGFRLPQEVIDFLDKEYSSCYYNDKYLKLLNNIKIKELNKQKVLIEYLYFFLKRVKKWLLRNFLLIITKARIGFDKN